VVEPNGKCHICRETREVAFCEWCQHWFCARCRKDWFGRGWAFVKERFGGPSPGCCGVTWNG